MSYNKKPSSQKEKIGIYIYISLVHGKYFWPLHQFPFFKSYHNIILNMYNHLQRTKLCNLPMYLKRAIKKKNVINIKYSTFVL